MMMTMLCRDDRESASSLHLNALDVCIYYYRETFLESENYPDQERTSRFVQNAEYIM